MVDLDVPDEVTLRHIEPIQQVDLDSRASVKHAVKHEV